MSCSIDPERISLLVDGELSPDEAKAVEEHLATCPECARIHEELRELAHLYLSTHQPVLPPTDLLSTTMEKLATVRTARTRRPRRRRLLALFGSLAAAAVLAVVLLLLPSRPTGTSEGALLRHERDGWMWAGPATPIQERCAFACAIGSARIDLEDTGFWLEQGTLVTVASIEPPIVVLHTGGLLVRNDSGDDVLVRTRSGQIRGGAGSAFAVREAPVVSPDDLRAELLSATSAASALGWIVGEARASDGQGTLVVDSLRLGVSLPDGDLLPEGEREVRSASSDAPLRAPFDRQGAWWRSLDSRPLGATDLGEASAPLLEVVERALASGDAAKIADAERTLLSVARALSPAEAEKVERWLRERRDPRRVVLATQVVIRRGRAFPATREALVAVVSDAGASELLVASAVAVLSAIDGTASEEALTIAAGEDRPADIRLLATWGLLAAEADAGPECLRALLESEDDKLAAAAAESVHANARVLPASVWRALLDSSVSAVRRSAAIQLRDVGDHRDVTHLLSLIANEREDLVVRNAAAYAIPFLLRPGDAPRLARLIESLSPDSARGVVPALLQLPNDPAVASALLGIRHRLPEQEAVILATLAWRDRTARSLVADRIPDAPLDDLPLLVATLVGTDEEGARAVLLRCVQREAAGTERHAVLIRGLARVAPVEALRHTRAFIETAKSGEARDRSVDTLARLSIHVALENDDVSVLVRSLESADLDRKIAIVRALGRSADSERAGKTLIDLLRASPARAVRIEAATALRSHRTGDAASALATAATRKGEDETLVVACLASLARIQRLPANAEALLESGNPDIRFHAALAVATSGGEARALRTEFLSAPLTAAVELVEEALAAIQASEAARATLLEICANSPSHRLRMMAPRFADDAAAGTLRERLSRDTHWLVRMIAASAEGAKRMDLALALASAPTEVPPSLRRRVERIVPVERWQPVPTTPDWANDDTPLTTIERAELRATMLRALDEGGILRTPEDRKFYPEARAWLPRAARFAASLRVERSRGDQTFNEFYGGLIQDLRTEGIPD